MENSNRKLILLRGYQIFSGIFLRNPILITGLVLAPAVVAAYSLPNAVALSVVLWIVTLPTILLASLLSRFAPGLPRAVLPVFYVLCSAVMLVPSYFTARLVAPAVMDAIGIYGPLLAFNSILFSRAKHYPRRKKPLWAVLDAACYCLGFTLAICLVGALREVLGAGTLWGVPMGWNIQFNGLLMPFGGCILVGMLSALCRRLVDEFRRVRAWCRRLAAKLAEKKKKKLPESFGKGE